MIRTCSYLPGKTAKGINIEGNELRKRNGTRPICCTKKKTFQTPAPQWSYTVFNQWQGVFSLYRKSQ